VTYQGMKFPGGAPGPEDGCGENPKRVYGREEQFPPRAWATWPATGQWIEAQEYLRDQQEYERKHAAGDKDAKPPKRDVKLDTLAAC